MTKKIVYLKVELEIELHDGVDIEEVTQDMDYSFTSQTEGADIFNIEILEEEVFDPNSK